VIDPIDGRDHDSEPRRDDDVTPRQERVGLLCAALCALNGAFVPAVAKFTAAHAEPGFVAAVTSLFGGLFAAIVLGLRGDLRVLARPAMTPRLVALAALGTTAPSYLFFLGASRASAIDAVLCLQCEPAYSLLLAWLVLGHRPTARRVAAIGVLLAGIGFAVGAHGVSGSTGVWILLATPLCWQLSHLIVLRRLVGMSPSVLTGARYIHGGILLTLGWLLSGGLNRLPDATVFLGQLPWLALQGMVLSFGGTLLWYGAITRLDLARSTAIVVPSVPLLSLGASFAVLGEVPTAQQWIGLLLTGAGVMAFVTAPHATTAPA